MEQPFTSELEERFVRYASIDTESDEMSDSTPSTEKQYDLLKLLAEELKVNRRSGGGADGLRSGACYTPGND